MKCENCTSRGYDRCWCSCAVDAPLECTPCRYCGKRDEMYAEIPVCGGWPEHHPGPGFVMRIGCVCDESIKVYDWRTEFEYYVEAIAAWNRMQQVQDGMETL